MRYCAIQSEDIANGNGIGVSLYTQGCPHHCPGCFSQETWNYEGGFELTNEDKQNIIDLLSKPYINHFSILGGEPLISRNLFSLACLIRQIKIQLPRIKIWIWTGYEFEELVERIRTEGYLRFILENTDVIIDGPYLQEKRDITLKWRGSTNQRVISCAKSLKHNHTILFN